MSTNQLTNVSPAERLDAIVESATAAHYQRLNESLDGLGLDLDAQNELFSLIVSLRDAGAVAGFRAGWQAATAPGAWILG